MKRFMNLENIGLKAVSVLLALLLWAYVHYVEGGAAAARGR